MATMTADPEGRLRSPADRRRAALVQHLEDLLSGSYPIEDAAALGDLVRAVRWQRVGSGRAVPTAPSGGPRAWIVVLGCLRLEPEDGAPWDGERDAVPGDLLWADDPSLRRVLARRDTVLAGLSYDQLQRLVAIVPELLLGSSGPLLASQPRRPARAHVLAVIAAPDLDQRYVTSWLADGMAALGRVESLWPARVDRLLSRRGASQREPGETGDVAVAQLLDDVDAAADLAVLEVGPAPDPWSRRALGVADRVVVVATPDSAARSGDAVRRLADVAPAGVPRDLVLLRPDHARPSGSGGLLRTTGCRQVHHVTGRAPGSRDLARVARLLAGRGRGLVLSGGGARGFAHLGVLRALEELGVDVDVFAGSSIGSPLAAGMADGIAAADFAPLVQELFEGVLDYTVPLVALTSGRRIAAATRSVFGDRGIEDLRHPFRCVSTDLTAARPHVHRSGSVVKAVRASCAIPGVLPPVPHDGHLLVDGGVVDNLPVAPVRELAPSGEVIAVDVVTPSGPRARDDYGLWVSGLTAMLDRRRGTRGLPPMGTTIMRALTVASEQRRDELALTPADCHLRLDLRGVPMLDFTDVRSVMRRGYDQAMPRLEAWLAERTDAGGAS